jgi:8-oxo-dGTP pyrophosphatase MutT (NUDIX family)
MIDLQNARINTAGAYIVSNGFYIFAIGIRPHHGRIPVVRLGGHREEHETGWQCAVREVYEEASLQIEPIPSHTTYSLNGENPDEDLQEIEWTNQTEQEPVPSLVVSHSCEEGIFLSLMYLAQAKGTPTPSSEVKGLLLLTKEEIHRLCREHQTLEQFLRRGGIAIMDTEFDKSLVLEPFLQLRLLSRILARYPEFDVDFH